MFTDAQTRKLEVKFSPGVPADVYGYALVKTKKPISVSSVIQRQFDSISVILGFCGFHSNPKLSWNFPTSVAPHHFFHCCLCLFH